MRKAEEMGVEMPKYMKPGAFNPLSYAEQVQKRKMLWSKPAKNDSNQSDNAESKVETTKEQPKQVVTDGNQKISFNKWETTNFGNDTQNEKFRRLMGIKATPAGPLPKDEKTTPHSNSGRIQEDLEKNYEAARQQTHRNRGLGLGFSNTEPALPGSATESRGVFGSSGAYPPTGQGGGIDQIGWNKPSHAMSGGINFVRKHH